MKTARKDSEIRMDQEPCEDSQKGFRNKDGSRTPVKTAFDDCALFVTHKDKG